MKRLLNFCHLSIDEQVRTENSAVPTLTWAFSSLLSLETLDWEATTHKERSNPYLDNQIHADDSKMGDFANAHEEMTQDSCI
ncbi:hypothetical protein L1887_18288 [Cichorium endivia]|nr:hypothetical protein L1887_18288 [Cichorium endivia]